MTKRNQTIFLQDILESIKQIEGYVLGITQDAFWLNKEKQDAVIRRVEIIGEAAKNVADDFKKEHQCIPWKDICGMRDILTHDYFGVNLERVWKTIKNDLPPLKKEIEKILETEV
jgi:uncharacterized protein with HEPN domain